MIECIYPTSFGPSEKKGRKEPEFLQTVERVFHSLALVVDQHDTEDGSAGALGGTRAGYRVRVWLGEMTQVKHR